MEVGSPRRRTGTASTVVPAKVRVPAADGLPRERLEALLDEVWQQRLGLVVAPAGSGKTTLLARFAARADAPVAWYRAETWDADEAAALRHLEAALRAVLPGVAGNWRAVEDAAAALDGWAGGRAILVIDDMHALEETPAETVLGRFVDYAPDWLAILIGSRVPPRFNLSRRRVSGELLEIAAEDLRFRAWEVERLFRDFYGDPVAPGDLAVLARRTEGWAAGLQLFHLATRGKTADERRRVLSAVRPSGRLLREYLARNVMEELPEELREFLVETCVLGRLTGALCDALRGRGGSAQILGELARRHIFTVEIDEADGSYRYHEVLRSHLDRTLVERVGEDEARARYARAGELLEAAGALAEALQAYSRAEDWAAVRRLLGGQGEQLADGVGTWVESLPPAIIRHEPWLELAVARRARAEGRWADALEAYGRAETAFGASAAAAICQQERLVLRAWLEPVAAPPAHWTRLVRVGLAREPLSASRAAASHDDLPIGLVRGVLELAAGDVAKARRELAAAVDAGLSPALTAAARLGSGVARLLGGDPSGAGEVERAVDAAERAGAPWLARLARTASRLGAHDARVEDAAVAGAAFGAGDEPWGIALAALVEAWNPGAGPSAPTGSSASADPIAEAAARGERRLAAAERAAVACRRLGSGVLETWARGLIALAQAELRAAEARESAIAAESIARTTGTPGTRLLAYEAMAMADPERAAEYRELAAAVSRETGLALPPGVGLDAAIDGDGANGIDGHLALVNGVRGANGGAIDGRANGHHRPAEGGVAVRTFGGFAVTVDGRSIALDKLKPRARALLRLLALHAGAPVHREVIGEALWPEADAQTAARSLQVGVSAIRGTLADALGPGQPPVVAREGDAYRLALPSEVVDVRRFERAIADGRVAQARGLPAGQAYRVALAIHAGELLPEDGPEEWVVEARERYRRDAVGAARAVAEEALGGGDARTAIEACRAGLAVDRYDDSLWRLLIDAHDRAGDVGAASRDRREYEGVLAALGVGGAPAAPAS